MKKNTKTPAQYLVERCYGINTDVDTLCKDYAERKKITRSEVFAIIGKYWDNQPVIDASITTMVQIWYCAVMHIVNDEELDKIFDWFYN